MNTFFALGRNCYAPLVRCVASTASALAILSIFACDVIREVALDTSSAPEKPVRDTSPLNDVQRSMLGVWAENGSSYVYIKPDRSLRTWERWSNGDVSVTYGIGEWTDTRIELLATIGEVPAMAVQVPPKQVDGRWVMQLGDRDLTLLSRDDFSLEPIKLPFDPKAPPLARFEARGGAVRTRPGSGPVEFEVEFNPPSGQAPLGATAAPHSTPEKKKEEGKSCPHEESFSGLRGDNDFQGSTLKTPAGVSLRAEAKRGRIASRATVVEAGMTNSHRAGEDGVLMLWGTSQASPRATLTFPRPATQVRFAWSTYVQDQPLDGHYVMRAQLKSGAKKQLAFKGLGDTVTVDSPQDPIVSLWLGSPERCGYTGIVFDEFEWMDDCQ